MHSPRADKNNKFFSWAAIAVTRRKAVPALKLSISGNRSTPTEKLVSPLLSPSSPAAPVLARLDSFCFSSF